MRVWHIKRKENISVFSGVICLSEVQVVSIKFHLQFLLFYQILYLKSIYISLFEKIKMFFSLTP